MGIRRHQQGPGASLQAQRPGNPLGSTRSVGSPGASSAPPRRARRMRASPLHSGRRRPHHLDISCQADVVRKCMMLSAHLDSTGLTAELGDVTFCISYSGKKKPKLKSCRQGGGPGFPNQTAWSGAAAAGLRTAQFSACSNRPAPLHPDARRVSGLGFISHAWRNRQSPLNLSPDTQTISASRQRLPHPTELAGSLLA